MTVATTFQYVVLTTLMDIKKSGSKIESVPYLCQLYALVVVREERFSAGL